MDFLIDNLFFNVIKKLYFYINKKKITIFTKKNQKKNEKNKKKLINIQKKMSRVKKTTVTKTTVTKTTSGGSFDPKNYEKNGLTADEVIEIKEAFDLFDSDKSGQIDTNELKQALQNLGIDAKNQTLQNMLADIDKNGSGDIDFDEFIDMMTAKMSDKDTREDLQKVFDLFLGDDDGDKIELKHLKRVVKELNENLSDDELNEMITRADTDRDGKVSFEEFYNIMTKKI